MADPNINNRPNRKPRNEYRPKKTLAEKQAELKAKSLNPPIKQKRPKYNKISPNVIAIKTLTLQGCKNTEIAEKLNLSNGYVSQVQAKTNTKYDLSNLESLAHKAIKDTLRMKPVEITKKIVTKDGDVIEYTEELIPSHTNRLTASDMVLVRTQPVVQRIDQRNVNVNISDATAAEMIKALAGMSMPDLIDIESEPNTLIDIDKGSGQGQGGGGD